MANNLRVFNTNSEYQSADLILPSVSYVVETDKVIYNITPPTPPVFQGKWLARYSDSHVESAQCGSSSEIVENEINKTNLVSVELGHCVTSIGNEVFSECESLTSVTIPDSVTSIGGGAFAGCSFTSIAIPSGVTSIGNTTFLYCTSLTSIDIPDSVTTIGRGAFDSCESLTSIDIPNSVTSIGDDAFYHCYDLTSCTIGSGVISIGTMAFIECRSLTSCTIGSGVTSIGNSAFQECRSLTSITVEAITPPTLRGPAFNGSTCPIYVPSESVNAYKRASGWRSYASRIQAIP